MIFLPLRLYTARGVGWETERNPSSFLCLLLFSPPHLLEEKKAKLEEEKSYRQRPELNAKAGQGRRRFSKREKKYTDRAGGEINNFDKKTRDIYYSLYKNVHFAL